jgi:hypothetical protein
MRDHLYNVHGINLKEYTENIYEFSKEKQSIFDRLILKFFITSGISYRIINNDFFKLIFRLINPSIKLIDRLTLSINIKKLFLKEKEKIIKKLQNVIIY